MTAEDILALCMLLVLVISAGSLATILFPMMRNAGREDELADLLKDDEAPTESETEPAGPDEESGKLPWEKDPDWWRE